MEGNGERIRTMIGGNFNARTGEIGRGVRKGKDDDEEEV